MSETSRTYDHTCIDTQLPGAECRVGSPYQVAQIPNTSPLYAATSVIRINVAWAIWLIEIRGLYRDDHQLFKTASIVKMDQKDA